jgi:hypothetical protein
MSDGLSNRESNITSLFLIDYRDYCKSTAKNRVHAPVACQSARDRRPGAGAAVAGHANIMPAQQLAKERVVTAHDGGRGLTVEGAKQGQAPVVMRAFSSSLTGTLRHGTVRHDYFGNGDGLEVHGVRLAMVPEKGWGTAEMVSTAEVQEASDMGSCEHRSISSATQFSNMQSLRLPMVRGAWA